MERLFQIKSSSLTNDERSKSIDKKKIKELIMNQENGIQKLRVELV